MATEPSARGVMRRRRDAAIYLREKWGMRCAEQTLAKYAVLGNGPTFQKYGRDVVYAEQDLDDWASSRLSAPARSTSDRSDQTSAAA